MVRRAKAFDASRIAEIHVTSWQVAYRGIIPDAFLNSLDVAKREQVWRDVITETANPVFVAESAGSVVGFCHLAPSRDADLPRAAEITAIYLDPDHWRRGGADSFVRGQLSSRANKFFARSSCGSSRKTSERAVSTNHWAFAMTAGESGSIAEVSS